MRPTSTEIDCLRDVEFMCAGMKKCPSDKNDTKTQWISIELEIQSITRAKFYEHEKKSRYQ